MESLEMEEWTKQQKSSMELVGLTSGFTGLQVAYSIQFAFATDALSSLGFSRASISAIWLIPPTCGAVVQPFFGAWSDLSQTRWGRRKPFVVSGAIGLCISLLAFAEVAGHSRMRVEYCRAPNTCPTAQMLAVLLILAMNISASAIQMGLRALLVDTCADHEQSKANAWVGRLTNTANMSCYLLAYTDVSRLLPWAGSTQLQALSRLGALWIGISQVMTCLCAGEDQFGRGLAEEPNLPKRWTLQHWTSLRSVRLSRRMWIIQGVQFLSWFAWSPFLSYISSYVDQLARTEASRAVSDSNGHSTGHAAQAGASNEESGSRYGSLALLCFASVALLTTSFVPSLCSWLALKHGLVCWKTRIWCCSQLLYATSLVGALVVQSAAGSIFMAAIAGISWAVTQWIPFTLINTEILSNKHAGSSAGWAALLQSLSNVAVSIPQMLVSFLGTVVFSMVGENLLQLGTEIILGACSFASLLAAILVARLNEDRM